jgi:hypothetical protein
VVYADPVSAVEDGRCIGAGAVALGSDWRWRDYGHLQMPGDVDDSSPTVVEAREVGLEEVHLDYRTLADEYLDIVVVHTRRNPHMASLEPADQAEAGHQDCANDLEDFGSWSMATMMRWREKAEARPSFAMTSKMHGHPMARHVV